MVWTLIAPGPAAAQTVVRIAHVAPISGPVAHLGKDDENGARMAIDELNAQGVTIGGMKVKLELVTEDDAGDPKQATAVAQYLVDAKVNGVVGHMNSGATIPASKIYFDAGIPQIAPTATNPKLTRQGFNTVFRMVADDVQLGGALGHYSVNTLKSKAIAVIDDRTAYGQGVADEFAKAVKAAGGNIVATEYTTDKAVDFTAVLTSIKSKNPDLIFFGGFDASAGPMLRQMQVLGMKIKYMGGDGICSDELIKLTGGVINDDQVICALAGGVDDKEGQKALDNFKAKYKAKYNMDMQVYAPYVYDAVQIMVAAMVKAQSSDPAKYLPALAATDLKGVTGQLSFDAKGDMKNAAVTLYTYKNNQRLTLAVIR